MVLSICAVRYTFWIALARVDHAEASTPFDLAAVVAVDSADVLVMMIGVEVRRNGLECDRRATRVLVGVVVLVIVARRVIIIRVFIVIL